MNILSIESSCDETAAAVIKNGTHILSNVVVSQVDIFAAYGGVIPEIAARSHLETILPVIHQALNDANLTKNQINAIAVTHTPGLLGSLLIGTLTARALAILWHKPLYAVHHLKSHIYANWLESHSVPEFPLLALAISGGHTQILYMPAHNQFEIIGTTRDDAVGECFDKIAKILGLPYPGGPSISKLALTGNPQAYPLPHPMIDNLDFSFSGLKTAVLRSVQQACHLPITTPSFELAHHLTDQMKADFAASFEATACDILLEKLQLALKTHPDAKSIVFAGGVSANQTLRQKAQTSRLNVKSLFFPAPQFTGDNAAMVGAAAYFEIESGTQPTDPYKLNIAPRTSITN